MKTKVKKWGNSLALRIPKVLSEQIAITADTPVEMTIINEQIVISLLPKPEFTLNELLDGITEDNLHQEIDTGDAVGNEAW
jgi:antitoxin MazE